MNTIDKDWVDNHIDSNGEVIIPNGVQVIKKATFQGNDKLKKIILPDSVVGIEPRAFADCQNLENVELSNNLQVLGMNSFQNCTSLKEINIPSKVEVVYPGTFSGNTCLQSITLNGNLKYLSADAFINCKNVKEVNIHGVERIDYNAFMQKSSIQKITIDGQEFTIEDNQQLFSVQKSGEKVAIVTQSKDNGHFSTQCVNLEKNTSKTIGNNAYLTDDGKICYAIDSLASISSNALSQFKKSGLTQLYIYGGESEITPDQHSEGINFNLYNIDDLIQIKQKIENIKSQIKLPDSKDVNKEKKIYGQIVRILGESMQYDELEVDDYARLENRNLLGLLKGKGVCQGYVEILRNIAAEYKIQVESIRGTIPKNGKKTSHEWNQVKLDGVWYDDDFTNYREALSTNNLDLCHCFLMGARSDGISSTKYVGYETKQKIHSVGKIPSLADKKYLLNYGHVKQQTHQQSIQPQEREKPPEKSIKDQVGDEYKPKTQEEQQNEQDAQTLWMNRLQTCDKTVDNMPEGAKKKQEVVQLIQNLEQEKRQERDAQIQEENQSPEQR